MKRLKTFEGWGDNSKPEYYVQRGKGNEELYKIKEEIFNSMNPPIEDIWETLSDSLLHLEDSWGKFTTKYENERGVIDIGMLDLDIDIGEETDYSIGHESDDFYNRGKHFKITDRKKKEEYRKAKSYDGRLSIYGSSFDQRFYNFYKKMNGKVKPFYSILIKFESEYVANNPEKRDEMLKDLISSIKTALRRLNAKIVKIEYFDSDNYDSKKNDSWVKVNDLSQVKYPAINLGFEVNRSLTESVDNEIEVKFVSKRRQDLAFNVYKTRDGRITRIENPRQVNFPYKIGQILNRNVETWACNNGFYMDGKDTCPEEKVFGIRKSDVPKGHELRHLFPNKFR